MALVKPDGELIDEMSIVDVLTKLIFNTDSDLNETELLIVSLLAQVDNPMPSTSRRDISEYLRAMGVDEMIQLVGQLKRCFDQQQSLVAANHSGSRPSCINSG